MVAQAGDLIEAGIGDERNSYRMWSTIKRQARIANAQYCKTAKLDEDGVPIWQDLTTHQKMKIAQDFLVTAFMSPEIGVRFLEAAKLDPIAMAKLTFSVMPKELHVDVQQQSGVVILPMKAESLETWLSTVAKHDGGEAAKDVTPAEYWQKKMEVADGALVVDSDSDCVDGDSVRGGGG
jgi:hypothetical protein